MFYQTRDPNTAIESSILSVSSDLLIEIHLIRFLTGYVLKKSALKSIKPCISA